MKCTACGAALSDGVRFCPQCGAPQGPDAVPTKARPGDGTKGAKLSRNDPEVDVWSGSYSPKAMVPSWAAGALLSVLALVGGATVAAGAYIWVALAAVAVIWLYLVGLLAYRRVSIRYRLTTQRFFHESGVLRREVNRVEVIDMDDISYSQGLIDRFLGVGNICITSSDRTDPQLWLRGIDQVRDVAGKIDDVRRKERLRRGMFIESV